MLVGSAVDEVAFVTEGLWRLAWAEANFYDMPHLPEAEHRPFSSSERQVRALHPVVGPTTHLLLLGIAEFIHRCTIRAKVIGGDRLRVAMALEHLLYEGESSSLVPGEGRVRQHHQPNHLR